MIIWLGLRLLLDDGKREDQRSPNATLQGVPGAESDVYDCLVVSMLEIPGPCLFVSSTKDSLKFTWESAKSAASYKLVGDGVEQTSSENRITVDGLFPGSHYEFSVWAVNAEGVAGNPIICVNSTGVLRFVIKA